MKKTSYTLEFLTPCFCAGATPGQAEIRPSAIRGQLRWWFRALGGSPQDEGHIFGGVAGVVESSALLVRIEGTQMKPGWKLPENLKMEPDAYVYYFAKVSGATDKGASGPRWQEKGVIPPGSVAKLSITWRRALDPRIQPQFDLAFRCFLQLGGIGLRVTRGLGCFACHEVPFAPDILSELAPYGFHSEHREQPLPSVDAIAREIGGLVKGARKFTGMKFDTPSPFGSSSPRQTSAIYFRPVRQAANSASCTLVVFEAPHERILGKISRKASVVGRTPSILQKPNALDGQRTD